MGKFIDETGNRYGRLVVLEYAGKNKHRQTHWLCRCSCGTEKVINGQSLRHGFTTSCGCYNKERIVETHKDKFVSEETKRKVSESLKKHVVSEETRHKLSESLKGQNSPNWKGGITKGRPRNHEYKEWRKVVYTRDLYTCQICGDNRGGNLVAHHIESYNNNPELRTALGNGITLCETCHDNFHHQFGYGNNTREQLNKFMEGRK